MSARDELRKGVGFGMYRVVLAAAFVLACGVTAHVSAQTPIGCGQSLSGTLSPGETDVYTFDAAAGEAVVATAFGVSGGVNARVAVLSPAGQVLGRRSSRT